MVRLRVWHNPSEGLRSSWLEVLQEAERWDSLGVGLLIDYHFSDNWADPEHQVPPRAWSGMTFEALQSAQSATDEKVAYLEKLVTGMATGTAAAVAPSGWKKAWNQSKCHINTIR